MMNRKGSVIFVDDGELLECIPEGTDIAIVEAVDACIKAEEKLRSLRGAKRHVNAISAMPRLLANGKHTLIIGDPSQYQGPLGNYLAGEEARSFKDLVALADFSGRDSVAPSHWRFDQASDLLSQDRKAACLTIAHWGPAPIRPAFDAYFARGVHSIFACTYVHGAVKLVHWLPSDRGPLKAETRWFQQDGNHYNSPWLECGAPLDPFTGFPIR